MAESIEGSCLCGAVRFVLTGAVASGANCHCRQCRKISGSAHATNLYALPEAVRFTAGEALLQRFEVPGRDFQNVFCSRCGSGLPHLDRAAETMVIPAGSLDGEPSVGRFVQTFLDEQPEWSRRAETGERHPGWPDDAE
ncbi:MAG TPA: GFA family protein [Pseudomonadales bacterium]|nr:GFA family protein [Pseudomonadales bacterium]